MIRKIFYNIILNKSVKLLFVNLSSRRKFQFYTLTALFIMQSFAELLSIGSVIPFITAISRPTFLLEEISKYEFLKNIIYLQTENQIILVSFILFIFLITLSAIIRTLTLHATYKISLMAGYEISLLIFNKIINQNISYFYKNDSSQITSFITTKIQLSSECLLHYFSIIYNMILIIIIFTALIFVNPKFTLLVFSFFLILYLIIMFWFKKIIEKNSYNMAKNDTSIIKLLREAVANIKVMIIHGLQDYYNNIFSKLKLEREKSLISNLSIASLPKIFMETIAIILLSSIAFAYIYNNNNDFIVILPYFAIIVLAGQKLLPIFQQSYFLYAALLSNSESVNEVTTFFSNKDNDLNLQNSNEKLYFNKSIKFENVSFDYGRKKFHLDNINAEFKKGYKVGIVGKSGSGKSTFIDLLMGLITPKNGFIKIDGQNLSPDNINKWHKVISHIPQSTYLNNETIYENIAYGVKQNEIKISLVEKIIKQLKLESLIDLMEKGYETKLGEKGNNISGGQRQKIAFARSFYRNFDVLVIDEATSSMDNISEETIFNEIYKLENKTVFIISHRLAFLKRCDIILEFENGKLINSGKYDDLLSKSQSFKELAKNTK